MSADPRAGQKAPKELLITDRRLLAEYETNTPERADASRPVAIDTAGQTRTSLEGAFNEAPIAATRPAIAEHRPEQAITGPRFVGMDTHAPPEPAIRSAVEV